LTSALVCFFLHFMYDHFIVSVLRILRPISEFTTSLERYPMLWLYRKKIDVFLIEKNIIVTM